MGFSPSKTCVLFLFPATILCIQCIYNSDDCSASETSAFKLFPVPCLQHKFLKYCLHKEILQFPTWGKAFSLVLICHQHNLNNFIKHKRHKMETHLFWWQTALFYGRKFVTWLQAHQVPCTCLQHTTLRLGCHPYRREMNTTVPKCYIHIIFPQMPEKDEIFFLPQGRKKIRRFNVISLANILR